MICLRQKRGQGMLESAVAVILMFFFLGGIINIWFWVNRQIVKRQQAYNASRVKAGTAVDNYELLWAPVHPVYFPQELSEEEIFLEAPAGSGSGGSQETPTVPLDTGRSGPFAPYLPTGEEETQQASQ